MHYDEKDNDKKFGQFKPQSTSNETNRYLLPDAGSNSEKTGLGGRSRFTMSPNMGTPEAGASNDQSQSTVAALRPEDQQFYGKLLNYDLDRVVEQIRQNMESAQVPPHMRETLFKVVHEAVQAVRPPVVSPPEVDWMPLKTAAEELNTSQSTIQRAMSAGYVPFEKKEVIVPRKMEIVGVRREGLAERFNRYQDDHRVGRPNEESKSKNSKS